MQIACQLAVGALDLVGAGVGGVAKFLIEVLFDPFALGHVASPPPLDQSVGDSDSAVCSLGASPLSGVSAASASATHSSATVSVTPTRAGRTTWPPIVWPRRSTLPTTGLAPSESPPSCCTASCRAGSKSSP